MKENYLWDKTGAIDPQIEQLENQLQAFRSKKTAPPALPSKVIPFQIQPKPRRRVFRFALAAAACLAFGALCLGVWFQVLRENIKENQDKAQTSEPPKQEKMLGTTSANVINKTPDIAQIKAPEEPQLKARKLAFDRNTVSAPRQSIPVMYRERAVKSAKIKPEKTVVRLTKEEQYAYNQLMFALSFTSSKLRLVRDRVEGVEEKSVNLENGR